MTLKAVLFDYGMVLSGPQDPKAHAELVRLTGLPLDVFERHYWADRHAYDDGTLTGRQYWEKIVVDAGLALDSEAIDELNSWDARMWTTENPPMIAWQQQLKAADLQTAILSNMGDRVLECVASTFDWIHRFDLCVWSYQLRMAKPNPAIYAFTLNKLQRKPQEVLFVDDRPENVAAAQALGIQALQFSTVAQLSRDLRQAGLDKELPLPA